MKLHEYLMDQCSGLNSLVGEGLRIEYSSVHWTKENPTKWRGAFTITDTDHCLEEMTKEDIDLLIKDLQEFLRMLDVEVKP